MNLSRPTKLFFLISLVFFIIGALGQFSNVGVPVVQQYAYLVAWVVLAAGCLFKGI